MKSNASPLISPAIDSGKTLHVRQYWGEGDGAARKGQRHQPYDAFPPSPLGSRSSSGTLAPFARDSRTVRSRMFCIVFTT